MSKGGRRKGKGLVFFGIVAGSIIGALVGLAFSPNNGDENREKLMEFITERAGM